VAPRIQIIVGSTRPGRFADKPVAWLVDRLTDRADLELDVLDLRDYPLPLFDSPMSPARTLREYPNEEVAKLGRRFDAADGYIAVTSEYNHGYAASLKNAMDYVFPEFNKKPITFVGYGNAGGARAIEQLRLVTVEFEMAPLRRAVHIFPDLMRPAMMAETFTPAIFESLDERLDMMVDELLWWTDALKSARDADQ
jgi:NAD(P)H-dependent FMN reductase